MIGGANHHMYARHAEVFNALVAGQAVRSDQAWELTVDDAAAREQLRATPRRAPRQGGGLSGPE